eukprot:scaffold19133_cov118-Isochrysis_galbana.AAC.1
MSGVKTSHSMGGARADRAPSVLQPRRARVLARPVKVKERCGAKIGGLNISAYAAAHGKLSFLYMSIDTLRIILHDFSSFPSPLSHVVAAAAVPETWQQAKAASGAVSGAWGM